MKRFILTLAALTALPSWSVAHEFNVGGLHIDHPYIAASIGPARTGAGYIVITNEGDQADTLIGVEADFPKVAVHRSETSEGVARMEAVPRLDIPAGASVEMAPGGLHIMFMGLEAPFEPGAQVPATLIFEQAGEVTVDFVVEERPATGDAPDHGMGATGHDGH
jgi:copper(I)-binding protein